MKRTLSLKFLGSYQVKLADEAVEIKSIKSRALLAYLAVETELAHTSETLIELLWPTGSSANLDQEILTLRQTFNIPDLILRNTGEVRLNPPASYWLDVAEFAALLAKCAGHKHEQQAHEFPELCLQCASWRKQAVDLYRGDFLKGLSVKKGSPEFDSWVQFQRDRLRAEAVDAMGKLACHNEWRGELELAQYWVTRQLELEPWHEEAHYQLMRLLIHRGHTMAALAQYELCRHHLKCELGVEPSIETTTLYERILAANTTPRHNLPLQPARLVGRQQELSETIAMLTHPDCRLLTIVGLGGIGKTRLAVQLAEAKAGAFLNGVRYVTLAGVGSADLLVTTIADALDLAISCSREPKQQLLAYLHQKEMLLVLDNFEHLLDGTNLITKILSYAPDVKILVTSRIRLNLLAWEWVFQLDGLTVPMLGESEPIERASAVQLFIQEARRIQSHFILDSTNAIAVARICQLVEGMPLAIKLAAAWVRVLTCAEIVAELERGIDLLTTSSAENSELRHSIRAVFEHTWCLLSANEQTVLGSLSVFRGGFQREAARQVAGATLPTLTALIDRSLVRLNSSGRYELHELIRKFAAEKLGDVLSVKEQNQDNHCNYFATFVQLREGRLRNSEREIAISEILNEIENIRAAWQWALASGNLRLVAKFLHGLSSFYKEQEWLQEGEEAISKAVTMLESVTCADKKQAEVCILLGNALAYQADFCTHLAFYEKAQELAHRSITHLRENEAHSATAFPLEVLGHVAWRHDEDAQARQFVMESLDIYRQCQDKYGMAQCLNSLGRICLRRRDLDEAAHYFHKSLELFNEVGARREVARVLNNLGSTCWREERHIDAQRYRQQGLAQYQGINDLGGIALCLAGLASTFYYLGKLQESIQSAQESLAIRRQTGDRYGEALTLFNLGRSSFWLGNYAAAEQYHHQSLAISNAINARWITGHIRDCLGELATAQGNYGQAVEQFEASYAIFREIDYQTGEILSLAHLGGAIHQLGDNLEAEHLVQEALNKSENITFREGKALSLQNLGVITRSRGEYAKVESLLEESHSIYLDMQHGLGAALTLCHLGNVSCALQDYPQAGRRYAGALRRAMEMQALPIALASLVGMARVFIHHTEAPEQAMELLTLVAHHPANTIQSRHEAWCLIMNLNTDGLEKIAIRAREQENIKSLHDVVDEVLGFQECGE